jgi:hypothetical protein
MAKTAPDGWKRFKTLVHYVCDRCTDPTKLGATKLNKALWYSDTFAYRINGRAISRDSAGYVKRQFGPVPKHVLRALDELEKEGALKIREVTFFGKKKREFISLKTADTKVFDDDEQEIINQVVDQVCNGHTAVSISDLSHDAIWEAADLGEEIPLYAVLAAKAEPPTKEDYVWAEKVIKRHKGALAKAA